MVWIASVNIPDGKKVERALTAIYGIGPALAGRVLKEAGIKPEVRAKDLQPEQVNRLKEVIERSYKIEGDLKRELMANIRRLRDIGSWRGSRHAKRLPVRGQRTRTNSRSVRGNVRKTVGSGRKPATSPT